MFVGLSGCTTKMCSAQRIAYIHTALILDKLDFSADDCFDCSFDKFFIKWFFFFIFVFYEIVVKINVFLTELLSLILFIDAIDSTRYYFSSILNLFINYTWNYICLFWRVLCMCLFVCCGPRIKITMVSFNHQRFVFVCFFFFQ